MRPALEVMRKAAVPEGPPAVEVLGVNLARMGTGGGRHVRRHRPESANMISKNLSRRLELLEDSLLPVLEEPLVLRIISVSPDDERVDSGIEFKVPAVPRPLMKRFR